MKKSTVIGLMVLEKSHYKSRFMALRVFEKKKNIINIHFYGYEGPWKNPRLWFENNFKKFMFIVLLKRHSNSRLWRKKILKKSIKWSLKKNPVQWVWGPWKNPRLWVENTFLLLNPRIWISISRLAVKKFFKNPTL